MRNLTLTLLFVATLARTQIDPNNRIRYALREVGANAGTKISAAIANLPAGGGWVDARGFEGAQTWPSCPTWGSSPIVLVVGSTTHNIAVDCTVPATVNVITKNGGILCPAAGKTLTLNGPLEADDSKHFCSTGTVLAPGHALKGVWFGAVLDGATDDRPALQRAVNAQGQSLEVVPRGKTAAIAGTTPITVSNPMQLLVYGEMKATSAGVAGATFFEATASNVTLDGGGTGVFNGNSTANWAGAIRFNGRAAAAGFIQNGWAQNLTVKDFSIDVASLEGITFYSVDGGGAKNVTVTHSGIISNTAGGSGPFGFYAQYSRGLVFEDNTCDTVGDTCFNSSTSVGNRFVHNTIRRATLFGFKGGYGQLSSSVAAAPAPTTTTFSVLKANATWYLWPGMGFYVLLGAAQHGKGYIVSIADGGTTWDLTTTDMGGTPVTGDAVWIVETGLTITGGNDIQETTTNGVDCNSCWDIKVQGNRFARAGNYTGAGSYGTGLSTRGAVWIGADPLGAFQGDTNQNVNVSDNIIHDTYNTAIIAWASHHVTITGNTVTDYDTGATDPDAADPIYGCIDVNHSTFSRINDVTVSGNTCRSTNGFGAWVNYFRDGIVSGNQIVSRVGVNLLGAIQGSVISNHIHATGAGAAYGIRIDQAGGYTSGLTYSSNDIAVDSAAGKIVDIVDPKPSFLYQAPSNVENLNGVFSGALLSDRHNFLGAGIIPVGAVSGAADNGSGLIRITTATSYGYVTGDTVTISGVTGTTEANGTWIVTVISAATFDLQGSTFTNTYVSGGTVTNPYVRLTLATPTVTGGDTLHFAWLPQPTNYNLYMTASSPGAGEVDWCWKQTNNGTLYPACVLQHVLGNIVVGNKLGVGTAAPGSALTVDPNGASIFGGILVAQFGRNSTDSYIGFDLNSADRWMIGGDGSGFVFYDLDATIERLRLNSTGFVALGTRFGFGTTAPGSSLTVDPNGATIFGSPGSLVAQFGRNSTDSYVGFNLNSADKWLIGADSGGFVFYDITAVSERLRLSSTGFVAAGTAFGVGMAAGISGLDVAGALRLSTGNILRPDNGGTAANFGNGTGVVNEDTMTFKNAAGAVTNAIAYTTAGVAHFDAAGDLLVGGTQRVTNAGGLVNVTANTSILTAGQLGLARGGTAVDGTAITATYVLAGPTSGGAGNATFRALGTPDIAGATAADSSLLQGGTWAVPGTIGSGTANTGAFTTVSSAGGGNTVYRCSVAGTLRLGELTTVSTDCGTAVDSGLRVP